MHFTIPIILFCFIAQTAWSQIVPRALPEGRPIPPKDSTFQSISLPEAEPATDSFDVGYFNQSLGFRLKTAEGWQFYELDKARYWAREEAHWEALQMNDGELEICVYVKSSYGKAFREESFGVESTALHIIDLDRMELIFSACTDYENEVWHYEQGQEDQADERILAICQREVEIDKQYISIGPLKEENEDCSWTGLYEVQAGVYQWRESQWIRQSEPKK